MKIVEISSEGTLRLIADSALGRDCMPLFLPQDGNWRGECRLALRIGRLGKSVSPKFAMRYVEAVTALLTIHPEGASPSWLPIMDSAVTAGTWIDVPQIDELIIKCNGKELKLDDWKDSAIASIVQVTAMATIKTGDIIIPSLPSISLHLERNARIEASLQDVVTLSLKVK